MADDYWKDEYARRQRRHLAVSNADIRHDERPYGFRTFEEVRTRLTLALQCLDLLTPADIPQEANYADVVKRGRANFSNEYRTATGEDPAAVLARLWQEVEDLKNDLPKVEGWAVVKVYYRGNEPEGRTAVWTMHQTREQAEEFAPKIAAKYASRRREAVDPNPDLPGYWGGYTDRFEVRWVVDTIRHFVGPTLTADEYVDRISL